MTLKQYMEKIAETYKSAAPRFIEEYKAEREAQEAIYQIRNSADLTPQGKQKKITALEQERAEHKKNMGKVAAEAREKALGVRREVEQHFYSRFHVSPADIDMNALELLKSGILTDMELANMAQEYANNCTMSRMIGKYMLERPSNELQRMGRVLQHSNSDIHLSCCDSIIDAGNYMLGGAPMSGGSAAETFYNRFDEITAQTFAAAPDIE